MAEGRDRWKVQDETARQSDEETPQAVRPERKTCCLDAPNLIWYKNFFASAHGLRLCEGAYSAVAQWQSIRLLTGGL
jgi:hypothetical protein